MKRNLLWTAPALGVALLLSGSNLCAVAQSIDAATDTAADAATDAGSTAGSVSTATDASTSTDSAASTPAPSDATTPAGASTSSEVDASAQTSTQPDPQTAAPPSANATTSPDASADATTSTQAPATPPATQPGAAANVNADANLSTDAAPPENQAPGSTPSNAAAATDANASIQADANLQANGQLGAQQNLQSGLQFGQPTDRGLSINAIARDHFFFNSGLRQGDILVSYAGRPIRSQADFQRWVVYQPGQRVPVVVLRDGRPQTIYVVYQQRQGVEHQAGYAPAGTGAFLGVTFDAQNPQQAVIRSVTPGSPAEQAGIRAGDVIFAINGNRVGGSQDVIRAVATMQPGQAIDVAISRQVVLGVRPGVAQASYGPNVRLDAGVAAPAVPAVPAPAPVVESDAFVPPADIDRDVDVVVPGSGRFDNTPARAGDVDRDGRLLDADGRVGPAEGRAILPRRRN